MPCQLGDPHTTLQHIPLPGHKKYKVSESKSLEHNITKYKKQIKQKFQPLLQKILD